LSNRMVFSSPLVLAVKVSPSITRTTTASLSPDPRCFATESLLAPPVPGLQALSITPAAITRPKILMRDDGLDECDGAKVHSPIGMSDVVSATELCGDSTAAHKGNWLYFPAFFAKECHDSLKAHRSSVPWGSQNEPV
jgi:hypothetical protein